MVIKSDKGFTLLEMLISLAVTTVILGLTMQAYMSALDANESVRMLADTNLNLQTGMNYIQQDLIRAGQNIKSAGIVVPGGSGSSNVSLPGPPPSVSTRTMGTTFYAIFPGDAMGSLINDTGSTKTDVITVSYIDDAAFKDYSQATQPAIPNLTLNGYDTNVTYAIVKNDGTAGSADVNEGGKNRIAVGDILVLKGGASGAILHEVTSVDGANNQKLYFATNTGTTKINQPGATSGGMSTLVAPAGGSITARMLRMVTYYIDRVTDTAHPRLMRQMNGRPAEPIALDIENLQVTYDLLPPTATSYVLNVVGPTGGQTPNDVRKVTIFLAGRSESQTKRKQFIRTFTQASVAIRSLGLANVYE